MQPPKAMANAKIPRHRIEGRSCAIAAIAKKKRIRLMTSPYLNVAVHVWLEVQPSADQTQSQ